MVTKKKSSPPLALTMTRFSIRVLTFFAPPLAARFVNYLWFKTQRYDEPGREKRYLESAVWQTLPFENKNIQLYIWGEAGKPIVLLIHGWNGRGAQLGAFAQPLIDAGYQVIAFDALGHGRSSDNSTNLPEISLLIQKIAQAFGPVRMGIAHSFGGLCLMHAITDGAQIDKVVCIGSAFNAERLVHFFSKMLQIQPQIVERHKRLLEQQFGQDIWDRFSMPNMVKQVSIPGLIIHDEDDDAVPVERSKMIAEVWPNNELVLTKGLGHRRILRDRTVIKRVTGFITTP